MKKIQIVINDDGGVEMKTSGYVGGECTKEVAKLEQGLAKAGIESKTTGIKYTDEYYLTQGQKQKVTA